MHVQLTARFAGPIDEEVGSRIAGSTVVCTSTGRTVRENRTLPAEGVVCTQEIPSLAVRTTVIGLTILAPFEQFRLVARNALALGDRVRVVSILLAPLALLLVVALPTKITYIIAQGTIAPTVHKIPVHAPQTAHSVAHLDADAAVVDNGLAETTPPVAPKVVVQALGTGGTVEAELAVGEVC